MRASLWSLIGGILGSLRNCDATRARCMPGKPRDKSKTSEDMQALDADEYFEGKMVDEAVNVFLSDRLLGVTMQARLIDPKVAQPSPRSTSGTVSMWLPGRWRASG